MRRTPQILNSLIGYNRCRTSVPALVFTSLVFSRQDKSIPYSLLSHVDPVQVLTHACYHIPLASLSILSGIETQLYKSNGL
jgi:hypothetical protein